MAWSTSFIIISVEAPVHKPMWCHASYEFVKPIWGRYNSMISYIYMIMIFSLYLGYQTVTRMPELCLSQIIIFTLNHIFSKVHVTSLSPRHKFFHVGRLFAAWLPLEPLTESRDLKPIIY
jgi:hypothetical protein